MLRFFLLLNLFFCCFTLVAQQKQDSIFLLIDTFYYDAKDNPHHSLPFWGIGMDKESINEQTLEQSNSSHLGELLAQRSNFFVKNYGPSNITTLSGRGGGAGHTALLWEGISIQNPMLGQADLSLVPTAFVDKAELQYGAASALFGNGSIGGAIHLGSQACRDGQFYFFGNNTYSTAGQWKQQFKFKFRHKRFAQTTRFFYENSPNNFPYYKSILIPGQGVERQQQDMPHAHVQRYGLLQEFNYYINTTQKLEAKLWYQKNRREIPPNLLQQSSEDLQEDKSLRGVLKHQYNKENFLLRSRLAYIREGLDFTGSGILSSSQFQRLVQQTDALYQHKQHYFSLGWQYLYNHCVSTGYATTHSEHQLAFFTAYRGNTINEKLYWSSSLRLPLRNSKLLTPSGALGLFYNCKEWLKLKANVSHNYRLPTFNDLYWDQLGNPDLLAEYSWNSEFGATVLYRQGNWRLQANLNGFSNWVRNWILWYPQNGVWRPDNVTAVWSRGGSLRMELSYQLKDWRLRLENRFAYTASKQEVGEEQRQLIYTPFWNIQNTLSLSYKHTQLSWQQLSVSTRYLNNANSRSLPWYHLGNLRLSQEVLLQKQVLQVYLQIDNIWNEDYQVVSTRPMPLRTFTLGLSLRIKGALNKKRR